MSLLLLTRQYCVQSLDLCLMKIPPIFIPTRGRWMKTTATWDLLALEGIECTLVVEPMEKALYKEFLRSKGYNKIEIEVLPLDNMGIGYARDYILCCLAPQSSWFWMIDDDIQRFYAYRKSTQEIEEISVGLALRIASPDDALSIEPKACIIGMEYFQFMHKGASEGVHYRTNSYANICVCMNRSLFPAKAGHVIRYRFPVREDYDLCMQVIASGGATFRFRCVGFSAPAMGAAEGGMTPFYRLKQEMIRKCNLLMLALWGDEVCKEITRGTGKSRRLDVKVSWRTLEKMSERALEGQPPAEDVIKMWTAKNASWSF